VTSLKFSQSTKRKGAPEPTPHPADIQDRDGGILLLATLFGMYPFLQTLFADAGYQGRQFHNALKKILPHLRTQIVKRSDQAKGLSHGGSGGGRIRPPHKNLTSNKNHNCNVRVCPKTLVFLGIGLLA
jgi:hypothetical protein